MIKSRRSQYALGKLREKRYVRHCARSRAEVLDRSAKIFVEMSTSPKYRKTALRWNAMLATLGGEIDTTLPRNVRAALIQAAARIRDSDEFAVYYDEFLTAITKPEKATAINVTVQYVQDELDVALRPYAEEMKARTELKALQRKLEERNGQSTM